MSFTDELATLRAAGYTTDFAARAEGLRCSTCGHTHDAGAAQVDRVVRFEGASDPDDEAILLALTCTACHARGVLIAPCGPAASGPEAAVIAHIGDIVVGERLFMRSHTNTDGTMRM
jgi:hypothetical protein